MYNQENHISHTSVQAILFHNHLFTAENIFITNEHTRIFRIPGTLVPEAIYK